MSFDLEEIKDRIDVPSLWEKLGYGGSPADGKTVQSPFREDRSASFSIYAGGKRWKDHSTDEGGDVFDFYCAANDCELKTAYREVAAIVGLAEKSYEPLKPPKSEAGKRRVLMDDTWGPAESVAKEAAVSRALFGATPELENFLERKKIASMMFDHFAKLRDLGMDEDGKLCYFFETGWKTRTDYNSSHGDRWKFGKAKGNLWRIQHAHQETRRVFLLEGESDTMYLQSCRPPKHEELYCGIPGASWTPDPVLAYRIGAHRKVYLCFDHDEAGQKATEKVGEVLHKEATNCDVYFFDWKKVWPTLPEKLDIGDLKESFFAKRFDECFSPLYGSQP